MEKNNPTLPVTESAGNHGIKSTNGSLDSGKTSETAIIVDVTKSKSQPAPANPPTTWSAGS